MTLKKVIEEIGIATYGGQSFEPTGMYREKLTDILTQHHQDLMSEKKMEGEEMIERGGWSPNQIEQLRDLFNQVSSMHTASEEV